MENDGWLSGKLNLSPAAVIVKIVLVFFSFSFFFLHSRLLGAKRLPAAQSTLNTAMT